MCHPSKSLNSVAFPAPASEEGIQEGFSQPSAHFQATSIKEGVNVLRWAYKKCHQAYNFGIGVDAISIGVRNGMPMGKTGLLVPATLTSIPDNRTA